MDMDDGDHGGDTPWDDDSLHEECGVYGLLGVDEAANYVALGLHALQHRGQESAGIAAYHPETGFNTVRRFGLVRDNFTKQPVMDALPGRIAIGHTRYSTAGGKMPSLRETQPLYAEFALGSCAIAHNGNLVNVDDLRNDLEREGAIFSTRSDTEILVHLLARARA
ncbi:MAG: amidophosphoribosyltransferase, partial [Pseudomonadota bacterium]